MKCDTWASRLGKTPKAHEKAYIGIGETTQLLSSVPVGEKCRNKGAHEDVLCIISITLARFVVRLAMHLASKKIDGFGEEVLSMTVALGEAECNILRLQKDKARQTSNTKTQPKVGSEWFTQDRDVGSSNDHHAPVPRDKWEQNDTLARET